MLRIFTIIAIFIVTLTSVYAQFKLSGINSIAVQIHIVEKSNQASSLETTIKTDVELKLRMASIKVNDYKKLNFDSDAMLYVGILALEIFQEEISGICYHVIVRLFERVTIPRLINTSVGGYTWISKGSVAVSPLKDYSEYVRKDVKDAVDEFINAYLKDNPK